MTFLRSKRGALFLYGAFVAICAGGLLLDMLTSPSEQENAALLVLSLPRLIFALGLFLTFMVFSTLALYTLKNPVGAERLAIHWFGGQRISRGLGWITGISLGLGMTGWLLPAHRWGAWSGYWTRIQLVMVFLLLGSLATWAVFLVMRIKTPGFASLRLGLPWFFLSLLIVGGMLYSGFGIRARDDFWYEAGVPILVPQFIGAIRDGCCSCGSKGKGTSGTWTFLCSF